MHYNRAMPASSSESVSLSIAVVLYHNTEVQLCRFRDALLAAVSTLRQALPVARASLTVVDNAAAEGSVVMQRVFVRMAGIDSVRCLQPDQNLGYGRAHNLCLQVDSTFHLILNPDVYLAPDALLHGVRFLQDNAGVGLVSPYGESDRGEPLFLCKHFPSVLDFVLRGFAPAGVRRWFDTRLSHYEMRDAYLGQVPVTGIDIASGCCMLLRTPLWRALRGFNEAYFLYFEDFDLSVRLREQATIAFLPSMRIVHDGGQAARKGWHHIRLFAASGFRFFSTHGWRWH